MKRFEDSNPIASRLVVGLAGLAPTALERRWLEEYAPAGVILFARNVASESQLETLCRDLHALLPRGAEICADQEGGPVSVLAAAIGRSPAPYTLGQVDDSDLTFAVYRDLADRARLCGIDRLLAPTADILSEALNPIIGSRSFGAEPEGVGRHVAAAVGGLIAGGVGCTLKHWPGHGQTRLDSHLEFDAAPVAEQTAPFDEGLRAGATAVMIGHLRTPSSDLPASLDPEVVVALRQRAPQPVLILSDDISMGALRPAISRLCGHDYGSGALLDLDAMDAPWLEAAARAGSDRLLCRGIPWRALPLGDGARPEIFDDPAPPKTIAVREDPKSWIEARQRASTPLLGPVDADLDWFDASASHRWPSIDTAGVRNAGWRGRLHLIDPLSRKANDRRSDCLLITSHLPLDRVHLDSMARSVPTVGRCLVMGHPSLRASLRGVLPSRWRVEAAFDSQAADLAPFFED